MVRTWTGTTFLKSIAAVGTGGGSAIAIGLASRAHSAAKARGTRSAEEHIEQIVRYSTCTCDTMSCELICAYVLRKYSSRYRSQVAKAVAIPVLTTLAHSLYRGAKRIFKAIRGTREVNRRIFATQLVDARFSLVPCDMGHDLFDLLAGEHLADKADKLTSKGAVTKDDWITFIMHQMKSSWLLLTVLRHDADHAS